jgi:hypothetical protein
VWVAGVEVAGADTDEAMPDTVSVTHRFELHQDNAGID